MLSRLVAPVTHILKNPAPRPAPRKGVAELLAALTEVRAKRAALEREEKEIIAATRARLREQQEALEALKRKVHDSGIKIDGDGSAPAAPAVITAEGRTPLPNQLAPRSN
jgi:hypothetical protein